MQKRTPRSKRLEVHDPRVDAQLRRLLIQTILRWYSGKGRTLPWRNISNPYRILVSEVMLQQTQVKRVLTKYPEFLGRFPSFSKLAAAKQKDVVIAWQGMGYNNRAARLHRLAKTVMRKYDGMLPRTYPALIALPGIGRYTANALLSSAFRADVPIVDVNIRRLFSRLFWRMKTTAHMRTEDEVWTLAEKLVPKNKAYEWNQALMDLGSTVCPARAPQCNVCPIARLCCSRSSMRRTTLLTGKREPSNDGVPNRIYRGRIIETLRRDRGRNKLNAEILGKAIYPQYSMKHRPWLESVLSGLEKDGLIRLSRNGKWNTQHVSLA